MPDIFSEEESSRGVKPLNGMDCAVLETLLEPIVSPLNSSYSVKVNMADTSSLAILTPKHKPLSTKDGTLHLTEDLLKCHQDYQNSRAVNGDIWRTYRSTKFAEEGHSSTLDKAKQLKESNCSTQETHVCNEEWDKANFKSEIEKTIEICREYVRQFGISFFCLEVLDRALIQPMEMRLVGLIIVKLLKKFCEMIAQEVEKHFNSALLRWLNKILVLGPMSHEQLRQIGGFEFYYIDPGIVAVNEHYFELLFEQSAIWEWPHTKSHSFGFVGDAEIKEWNLLVGLLKLAFQLPCPSFDIEMQWKGSGAHVSQYCSVDQHLKQFPLGGELPTISIKVLLVLGKNLIIGDFSEIPFNPGVVIYSFLHITLEDKGGFKGRYNWQNHGIGVRSCCQGSYYINEFNYGAKHGFVLYYFAHKCYIYKRSWQENCKKNYRRYTSRIVDTSYGKGDSNNLNSPLSPLTDVVLRVIQAACSSLVLSVHGWKILESSPLGVLLDPKIIGSRFLVYGIGKESSVYHCLDVFCNVGISVVLVKYKDVYPIGPDPSWRSRCPKAFLMFPKMKLSIWGNMKQMMLKQLLSSLPVSFFSSSPCSMQHLIISLSWLFRCHDLLIVFKRCTGSQEDLHHVMTYRIHFEALDVHRICWEYNVPHVVLMLLAIFLVSATQVSVTVMDMVNEKSKLCSCGLRPEASRRKDSTRKSQSPIVKLSELGLEVVALVVALASVVTLVPKEIILWYNKETADMKSHSHILFNDEQLLVVATSIELVRWDNFAFLSCSYMVAEHTEIVLCLDGCVSTSGRTLMLTKEEDLLCKCFESMIFYLYFLEDKEVLKGGELIRFKMEEVGATIGACTMGLQSYTVKLVRRVG